MIGYITKVSSFGALGRYLQAGTDGASERRVLWTTARYVSNRLQTAAREMNLTGHLAETKALGYHLTIGYDPADRPTRAEMEYAVERTLGALGLADNMAITAAHGDAYFAHTHTMVARWDYWTARVVEASNSYYAITRVMRELEDELGMAPAPRPFWERIGRKSGARARRGGSRAGGSPARPGERLSTATRNRARTALRSATSWGHLKALLQEEGLRCQRGRDNLLIAKGEATVRAGQITGGTSLAKLEARFGQTLREHEAEGAGRLIESAGEAPPEQETKGQEKTRGRLPTGDHAGREKDAGAGGPTEKSAAEAKKDAETGRKGKGAEKQAEDALLALAKAFRQREEAYRLARRSALLEAEEADVAGLQQDLQQLEARGAALFKDLLRAGAPSLQRRASNGASGGSETEENRWLAEQARKLWRAAARKVEKRELTRRMALSESLQGALGKTRLAKSVPREFPEEEKRLLALLGEHRRAARRAAELFGPEAASARGRGRQEEGGGNPWRPLEAEMPDKESAMNARTSSREPSPEEVLPEMQRQQDGAEPSAGPSAGPSAAPLQADDLLTETQEAIRGARLETEKRLRVWQRQVHGGEGVAEGKRRLRRVLRRLADRDPEAASRFARRYVLEPGEGREPEAEAREEDTPALDGENPEKEFLPSPAVQEALRKALPESVRLDGQQGPGQKSPSRSRCPC